MTDIFEKFIKAPYREQWSLMSDLVGIVGNNQLPDDTRVKAVNTISSCPQPEFLGGLLHWVLSDSDAVAEATMNAVKKRYEDILRYEDVTLRHMWHHVLFEGTDPQKVRLCQLFGCLGDESFFEYLYSTIMISQSEKVREQALKALLASNRLYEDKVRVMNHLRNLNWGGSVYSHLDLLLDQFEADNMEVKITN